MSATSWSSGFGDVGGAPAPFPGSGDKIVFYLAPQFRVTYHVGHIHTDQACEPDHDPYHLDGSRTFHGMEPINLDQWSRRAATVWELRSGIGNGQQAPGQPLAPELVDKLLDLDPMTSPQAASSGPARLAPLIGISRGGLGGGFPSPRFVLQDRQPWSSCDNAFQETSNVEIGQSSSTTTTYKYTGSVTYAGALTIPVGGAQIEAAGSYGQSFGFEYSRNEMTEHGSSTDAQAILGGGSDCPGDWYQTSGCLRQHLRHFRVPYR